MCVCQHKQPDQCTTDINSVRTECAQTQSVPIKFNSSRAVAMPPQPCRCSSDAARRFTKMPLMQRQQQLMMMLMLLLLGCTTAAAIVDGVGGDQEANRVSESGASLVAGMDGTGEATLSAPSPSRAVDSDDGRSPALGGGHAGAVAGGQPISVTGDADYGNWGAGKMIERVVFDLFLRTEIEIK